MRQKYSIFKKKTKDKRYFYAYFRNPETGERDRRLSIDVLNQQLNGPFAEHVSNINEARRIADEALEKGIVYPESKEGNSRFIDYVAFFWDFDKSPYITRKNKEKEGSITRSYAKDTLSALRKHCFPSISEGLKVCDFTPPVAEKIKDAMIEAGKSASTVNKVLVGIRVPLSEAFRLGYINEDVSSRIENLPLNSKERGILEDDEVTSLLRYLDENTKPETYERAKYLIFATAIYTGMRLSEIRALQKADIELSSSDDVPSVISIVHGYNQVDGLKTPKNRKCRKAAIPTPLAREILSFAEGSPGNFIFWSIKNPCKPLSNNLVTKWRKEAYEAIGISEERNVVFHSTRHTHASMTQDDISIEDRQNTLGHSSQRMTEYYTHETLKHIQKIGKAIEAILPYGSWMKKEEIYEHKRG